MRKVIFNILFCVAFLLPVTSVSAQYVYLGEDDTGRYLFNDQTPATVEIKDTDISKESVIGTYCQIIHQKDRRYLTYDYLIVCTDKGAFKRKLAIKFDEIKTLGDGSVIIDKPSWETMDMKNTIDRGILSMVTRSLKQKLNK